MSPVFHVIVAQQPYIGRATTVCDSRDNSTSVLGYTCNGLRRSCQAYLTFRAQPPYDSVASISTLLAANSSQLAQLNSVPENAVFDTNRMVLVPVTCSCSGFVNLSNSPGRGRYSNEEFVCGTRITVPLRCACPTKNQSDDGVNYLLSYLITWNQFVSGISALFGVDTGRTLAANGLSETSIVYPFTTLLVPLQDPPTSSQVTAPQPPPPPFATLPPSVPPRSGGSSKTWIYVVKAEPVVVSSQSFESIEKPLKKEADEDSYSQDFLESISSIAQSLKVYTFQELKTATQDFSPSCWIKGSVYRGTINGDFAAIKRMNGDVSKEINLLNKINHFNLIRLSGVSFNEGNWYLVYEYASNGPLSEWIHEKRDQPIMDWKKRLQIALDVASGLNYLHRYTSSPHVHKDLNSSNVLLDQDFRAKIANFGLARSVEGQEGPFALTRHIVGTKGYMAPEYLENGIVSPMLDVYAFGVLMLEILTGKTSLPFENLRNLMDPSLQGKYSPDLALVLFRLIASCLKKDPSDRPNMDDIFQSLSRISTSTLSGEWAIIFNFGDSNSDTGGLVSGLGEALDPPNGQIYFQKPSGRFCDGRLIIDFLMDAMDLPFLNPYLDSIAAPSFRRGCNFAAAGSTILPATASSVSPFSFGIQVAQFFRFKAKVEDILAKTRKYDKYIPAQDYFQKALYMFDIGQNDLAGAFYSKTLDQILASIPTILLEFEHGIESLYDQGARIFWIHNTGPLGCLPQNIAKFGTDPSKLDELGCVSSHNQASRLVNLQLRALCKKFQGQYPDANVTHVDIFTIKSNLIANYSRYGFEQPLMACCGYGGPPLNYDSRISCGQTKVLNGSSVTAKGCNDSTEYVNWDGIHYTEAANQYVASQVLTGKYSDPPFADKMPFLLKLKF
ncbi:UNVERIFIED_CONTAM: GDSL esterase/lipase [Sesamum angustifolium]|uniref:non-specific serine/threonine protein kinase n=1 Tax=Sesamum angustifolium TaxID=2727405 RepID=A0AAW2NK39_9LAMI